MFSAQTRLLLSASRNLGLRTNITRKLAAKSDENYIQNIERSLNQVSLIGRVGNKPEQRGTPENPVVLFSLATNTTYYKEGLGEEYYQDTQWHRIATFQPNLRDKVLRLVTKGSRLFVSGKINYFVKKNDQNPDITLNFTTIVASDLIILSDVKRSDSIPETKSPPT